MNYLFAVRKNVFTISILLEIVQKGHSKWCHTINQPCCRSVFFNWGSVEPHGSMSCYQWFYQNRPKLSGTKCATTVLNGLAIPVSQYSCHYESQWKLCLSTALTYCSLCVTEPYPMGFHKHRKHLRKIPLQQKGWKTLTYIVGLPCSRLYEYLDSGGQQTDILKACFIEKRITVFFEP